MRLVHLPVFWTVLLDILAWLAIHLGGALAMARLPAERFDPRAGLFRPRGFEAAGGIHERLFRIRAWKKRLPDGAPLLGRYGFPKQRLEGTSPAYFLAFARETCRAELTHWVIPLFAPLFFLWNRPAVGVFMIVYALAENLPFIIAQRYNRVRLLRVLDRREGGHGR